MQTAPDEPQTIGEHIRKRRLERHLLQKEVALKIGVHEESIRNWERGVFEPIPKYFPAIIHFLGYVPFKHDGTNGGKLAFLRLVAGLSQEEFGKLINANESTIWRWETNKTFGSKKFKAGIVKLSEMIRGDLNCLVSVEIKELYLEFLDLRNQPI